MNDSAPLSDESLRVDLERRVGRLENDVNALKDTQALEERVALKVTERLQKSTFTDKFTAAPPEPPPHGADSLPPYWDSRAEPGRYGWLFYDMLADARLMFIMLLDRRFPLAWTTLLVVWLFIPAILTSGWWFPAAWIPLVGPYLDKVLDLALAFGVYKALSREVIRYKEILGIRR